MATSNHAASAVDPAASRTTGSLGYHEVGTAPYEHRRVKQPCHFVEMRKSLRPVTALGVAAA